MCDVCRMCADVSKIFYYHPKSVASQNVVLAPKSSQSVGHACGRFLFCGPLAGESTHDAKFISRDSVFRY